MIVKYPELLEIEDKIRRNINYEDDYFKGVKYIKSVEKEEEFIEEKEKILRKYEDLFTNEIDESKLCPIKEHTIDTNDSKPICLGYTRIPIHYENAISDEIKKLLRLGIIRESSSPWRSRIVVVKKPDNSLRMCIDYRKLNEITKSSAYPIPRIDEIIESLAKAKIFSVLDATSGYYQIAMAKNDIEKNCF